MSITCVFNSNKKCYLCIVNKIESELRAPLIGIGRHRLGIDGQGVTTLVSFHGCTLRCHYCLNPQGLDPDYSCRLVTPAELVAELMADDLYFQATGGGVCFSGGEPLLHADFIRSFRQIAPPIWRITLETSLHVAQDYLQQVYPCVDSYIVDIKDTSPDIYHRYTSGHVELALSNLAWLISQGIADRITVRLPLIADYNTADNVARSRQHLEGMGITHFDVFEYIK